MKAVVFSGGVLSLKEIRCPEPHDGESLVKVLLAGICNTDLEIIKGYMGFSGVLGHEFVGEVVQSSQECLIGKRVVGEINLGCGKCVLCLAGKKEHCPNRSVIGILNKDGVFAEYITIPDNNMFIIPDNVSDEDAVFIEPLAAALRIIEQIHFIPSKKIAILGDGKLGLITAKAFQAIGLYKLTIFGHHENKLNIISDTSIEKFLKIEKQHLNIFDYVIDTTGSKDGLTDAFSLIKPEGTIILKSTVAGNYAINLAPVVINEIKIIGSRCGRFDPAVNLLSSGKISFADMVTAKFPIVNWREAFDKASRKDSLKVLIVP